jgi:AP-1 complex subunit beta-1
VGIFSLADLTALQTVAAGQVAENLLDFDDEPAHEEPTGLAATQVLQQHPAAKNNMFGNPLDDLVSIFALSSSGAPIASAAAPTPAIDALRGFGGVLPATAVPSTASNQQEDLLGLF